MLNSFCWGTKGANHRGIRWMKWERMMKKSRSEKAVDEGVEVPYPVVPSKKEKDRHLARILDIFRKL